MTLPVFVTRKEYDTVCPALVSAVGDADFSRVNAGLGAAVTVADEDAEVTGDPVGGVPEAVAESTISPASTSAWVAV